MVDNSENQAGGEESLEEKDLKHQEIIRQNMERCIQGLTFDVNFRANNANQDCLEWNEVERSPSFEKNMHRVAMSALEGANFQRVYGIVSYVGDSLDGFSTFEKSNFQDLRRRLASFLARDIENIKRNAGIQEDKELFRFGDLKRLVGYVAGITIYTVLGDENPELFTMLRGLGKVDEEIKGKIKEHRKMSLTVEDKQDRELIQNAMGMFLVGSIIRPGVLIDNSIGWKEITKRPNFRRNVKVVAIEFLRGVNFKRVCRVIDFVSDCLGDGMYLFEQPDFQDIRNALVKYFVSKIIPAYKKKYDTQDDRVLFRSKRLVDLVRMLVGPSRTGIRDDADQNPDIFVMLREMTG